MFVRNGQVLGSVLRSAEPGAPAEKPKRTVRAKKVESVEPAALPEVKEEKPEVVEAEPKAAPKSHVSKSH